MQAAVPIWEIEAAGFFHELGIIQVILHHELGQVAHHLAAGRHLHACNCFKEVVFELSDSAAL